MTADPKEAKKEQLKTTGTLSSHGQQEIANRVLDETRDNIRRATNEARREIPRYTQTVNDYLEQTNQAVGEIADNYIESQKEFVNSFQSAWVPYIENAFGAYWTTMSPRSMTEVYARMVSSVAYNTIATTKLVNNMVFGNIEAFKTSIHYAKDNVKELSRMGVNAAKIFEWIPNLEQVLYAYRITGKAD
jgi:hypothetical protein